MGKIMTAIAIIIVIAVIIVVFIFGKPYKFSKEGGITLQECFDLGGFAVNSVEGQICDVGDTYRGNVTGFISPSICCVPTEAQELI